MRKAAEPAKENSGGKQKRRSEEATQPSLCSPERRDWFAALRGGKFCPAFAVLVEFPFSLRMTGG
jgi:hypothetical protein